MDFLWWRFENCGVRSSVCPLQEEMKELRVLLSFWTVLLPNNERRITLDDDGQRMEISSYDVASRFLLFAQQLLQIATPFTQK